MSHFSQPVIKLGICNKKIMLYLYVTWRWILSFTEQALSQKNSSGRNWIQRERDEKYTILETHTIHKYLLFCWIYYCKHTTPSCKITSKFNISGAIVVLPIPPSWGYCCNYHFKSNLDLILLSVNKSCWEYMPYIVIQLQSPKVYKYCKLTFTND